MIPCSVNRIGRPVPPGRESGTDGAGVDGRLAGPRIGKPALFQIALSHGVPPESGVEKHVKPRPGTKVAVEAPAPPLNA